MTGTATPLLEIDNLTIAYARAPDSIRAVRNFSLAIAAGESHGLAGESGCGKSTVALATLRYLGRGGAIESGRILFDGADIVTMDEAALRQLRANGVAMVPQDPLSSLNPVLRIGDQLTESLVHVRGLASADAMALARAMLEKVRIANMTRVLHAWPHELSGGQQQRVLIAMALLGEPKLLLLDEPTTGLDASVQAEVVSIVQELARDNGVASLFVSHNLELIARACDRITIMYAGEAVETGTAQDVMRDPAHPYTRALLAARPRPGADRIANPLRGLAGQPPALDALPPGCLFANRCEFAEPGLCDARPMGLQTIAANAHTSACLRHDSLPPRVRPTQERAACAARASEPEDERPVVLSMSGVNKTFHNRSGWFGAKAKERTTAASRDVELNIHAGETLAIVGASGSGKSTIAKLLLGLETPDEGSITLSGREIAQLAVTQRPADILRAMQMVFQNPASTLNPSLTVGFQLERALACAQETDGEAAGLASVPALLEAVRLPPEAASAYPGQLSGGQKQRVAIARALAANPSILVADEPVSALDVSIQAAIVELLLELQRAFGLTLIFISHDLALVRYIADRVAVMRGGAIVEQGRAERIFAAPEHPYTKSLLSAAGL